MNFRFWADYAAQPIAAFEGKDLEAILQPVEGSQDGSGDPVQLAGKRNLVVFM